ncbi:MAG: hypothetical protein AAFR05_20745 [Bacteroidota bacterium]
MNHHNQCLPLIAVLLLFIGMTACIDRPAEPSGPEVSASTTIPDTVLSISDLHLDVFYSSTLVDSLRKAPYREWAGIFHRLQQSGFGQEGEDTHYNLFASLLQDLPQKVQNPHFVILSGDFLAHHFLGNAEAAGMSLHESQDFLANIIRLIADQLQALYPNSVFVPVLGNNDSYCGDYKVTPNGRFLSDMVPIWKQLLGKSLPPTTFSSDFKKGGYFTAFSTANHQHRILGLNSNLFSKSYMESNHRNYCGSNLSWSEIQQHAQEHLDWLSQELRDARRDTAQVWLVYHIPPGINVPGALGGSSSPTFWHQSFSAPFVDTLNAYRDVISAQLAGHTHMDHFMIFNDDSGQASSFVHITPAVSPIFKNNPAYFLYTYDAQSTQLLDYTAYYFQGVVDATQTQWKEEYRFQATYAQNGINAQSLDQLRQDLEQNTTLRRGFRLNYSAQNTSGAYVPTSNNWSYFACALTADSTYSTSGGGCIELPQR